MHRVALLCALLFVLPASALHAQSPAPDSLFRRLFETLQAGDSAAFSALFGPPDEVWVTTRGGRRRLVPGDSASHRERINEKWADLQAAARRLRVDWRNAAYSGSRAGQGEGAVFFRSGSTSYALRHIQTFRRDRIVYLMHTGFLEAVPARSKARTTGARPRA